MQVPFNPLLLLLLVCQLIHSFLCIPFNIAINFAISGLGFSSWGSRWPRALTSLDSGSLCTLERISSGSTSLSHRLERRTKGDEPNLCYTRCAQTRLQSAVTTTHQRKIKARKGGDIIDNLTLANSKPCDSRTGAAKDIWAIEKRATTNGRANFMSTKERLLKPGYMIIKWWLALIRCRVRYSGEDIELSDRENT